MASPAAPPPPSQGAEQWLRQIPAVEEVLNRPGVQALCEAAGRKFVTARVREVFAGIRQQIREGLWPPAGHAALDTLLETTIRQAVEDALAYSLRPVINATGVI